MNGAAYDIGIGVIGTALVVCSVFLLVRSPLTLWLVRLAAFGFWTLAAIGIPLYVIPVGYIAHGELFTAALAAAVWSPMLYLWHHFGLPQLQHEMKQRDFRIWL
jgi:hypothetical protein